MLSQWIWRRFKMVNAALFTLVILSACSGVSPSTPVISLLPTLTPPPAPAATALPPAALPLPSATAAAVTPPIPNPPTVAPTAQAAAAACKAPAALTPALTEGPYFKAGSPLRGSLVEAGMQGTRLQLSGSVLTGDCQPVANAKIEFWQADAQGVYDNTGYTLRGHVISNAAGAYQVETILPGLYPGRTAHIHVKVLPPGAPELITQLFVPGEKGNQTDSIYNPALVMDITRQGDAVSGRFNFIVKLR